MAPMTTPKPSKPPGTKKSRAASRTSIPAKQKPFPGKRSVTGFRPNLLMAAKSVEFLEEASAEYEEALDWYLARSESSASKFPSELAQAIGMIAEAPQRWPAGPY